MTLTKGAAADELLSRDPLALLIGMLLDQHRPERSSDLRRGSRPYGS